jgi:hypothetical protein
MDPVLKIEIVDAQDLLILAADFEEDAFDGNWLPVG